MISEFIKEQVKQALKSEYGFEADNVPLEHPNNEEWGDFATSVALQVANELKQSPEEIAKAITYKLNGDEFKEGDETKYDVFEEIYFAPPGFINFVLSKEWLYNVLHQIYQDGEDYGTQEISDKIRIALEHSNVNPNKAAHVGHLRNACVGQFVERSYESLGYDVEVQYYANDVGVQVATSSMGVEKISEISPKDYKKFDHYAWDVYSMMESLIKKDESLQKEREERMKKLEDFESDESKKQRELADEILLAQLTTFQHLDIDYDVVIHERDIIALKFWDQAFEQLKKNENVYKAESGPSKGCWLVRLGDDETDGADSTSEDTDEDSEHEEDKIIVRSNGVPTYTGKDIAYHMWKFGLLNKDFYYKKLGWGTQETPIWTTTFEKKESVEDVTFTNVDRVFDVIGTEQSYAIETVRQSLGYLGYEDAARNMVHINYGFVFLSPKTAKKLGIDTSDGKSQYAMSGRKGWGIKIDDFMDMVDDTLMGEYGNFKALHDVRNGAIKFEMLKYNTFQDLIFDLDEALNIHGYSGPYLQYTHARANSVLEKSGFEFDADVFNYEINDVLVDLQEKELDVLRYLYRYPEVVEYSAEEFAPNAMCTYLFELSQRFNSFYNDVPIMQADTQEQKDFRLALTQSVKQVLKNGLYLLGINAPAKI